MTVHVETPEQLVALIGEELRAESPVVVMQSQIDAFCAVSGDRQWIHTKGDESSIVPGNLLIALLPRLIQSAFQVESFSRCLTARYDAVKFRQPVLAGDRLEFTVSVSGVKTNSDKTYCEMQCKLLKDNAMVVEARVIDVYYR